MQEALPREMYVDEAAWRVERDAVLYGEWFCAGRRDRLGLADPSRVVVLDVAGESVLVTSDEHGALHGAYNVCRHRGSQLLPAAGPAAACEAAALRCPYHSWTYGLDGRLLKAPHADVEDAPAFSLKPVGVDVWCGFVFVHLSPARARPLAESVDRAAGTLANYGLGDLVVGATFSYDVAANYKVLLENYNECYHCGPVHPELCRLVPSFAGGGDDLDWEAGIPHREGAWTFTKTGTTIRAPLPGLDADERTRHKGDLVYPNLMLSASADHVAAFVLLPHAPNRTTVECSLLFAKDAAEADDFDPSDAGELWDLVNRQDWAVCESVQRGMSSRSYRHGWFAPMEDDSLDIRRWLLPRLGQEVACFMSHQVDYVVAGLGALGSAAAYELASRGRSVIGLERFELGHTNGASHDASRILRHSYHTPAYVRLTVDAYADWARLEQVSGLELVTKVGGLDLFPPQAAIPPIDYADSLTEVGIEHEVLDAAEVAARWPQFDLASGVMALYQRDAAIVPAGFGTRTLQEQATRLGADLRPRSPGHRRRGPGRGRDRGRNRGRDDPLSRARGLCGRMGQRRPRAPRCERAGRGDARAGHLLPAAGAGPLRAGADAPVDLDGRSVLLRLPELRRADDQGRPGLRRTGRRPRGPDLGARPRDGAAARLVRGRPAARQRPAGALVALSVHADA